MLTDFQSVIKGVFWCTLHVIRLQLPSVPGPRTRPSVGSADLQRESGNSDPTPKAFCFLSSGAESFALGLGGVVLRRLMEITSGGAVSFLE